MIKHLIVPVDGSAGSWRGFDVAVAIARRCHSDVRVIEVASDPVNGRDAEARLTAELNQRGPFDVEVTTEVRLTVGSVADEVAKVVALHEGAIVVMASHGKGRSAALVGSITEDILHTTYGPIVLVGPKVKPTDLSGPVIVSVDGSQEAELALPLAAAWAIELKATPWIVNVAIPSISAQGGGSDNFETAYPARLAKDLAAFSGHAVEFDELHDKHPERAVPDYAERNGASMIVASSHGRSGLSRLTMGSVTAGFVRNATCPVTVVRLPHPLHVEEPDRMWAY